LSFRNRLEFYTVVRIQPIPFLNYGSGKFNFIGII
jgi:hypothetical protein